MRSRSTVRRHADLGQQFCHGRVSRTTGCRSPLPACRLESEDFNLYNVWATTGVGVIKSFIQEKAQDTLCSKCAEFKNSVKTSVIKLEMFQLGSRTCQDATGRETQAIFKARGKRWHALTRSHPTESFLKPRPLGKGEAKHLDMARSWGARGCPSVRKLQALELPAVELWRGSSSAGQGEKGHRLACGAMLPLGGRGQAWSLRLLGHRWFHLTIFLLSGEFSLLHLHNHGWPWHSYTVQEDLRGPEGVTSFFFSGWIKHWYPGGNLSHLLISVTKSQWTGHFVTTFWEPLQRWLVNLCKGTPFQDTFC